MYKINFLETAEILRQKLNWNISVASTITPISESSEMSEILHNLSQTK